MLNEAKIPESLRKDLWTECANTATDIDNLIVSDKIFPTKPSMKVFPKSSTNFEFLDKWQ